MHRELFLTVVASQSNSLPLGALLQRKTNLPVRAAHCIATCLNNNSYKSCPSGALPPMLLVV
jgi:hypothetical protein